MNNILDYLFVYGTLRPGFDNPYARLLRQHSQYVGEGKLTGQLFDIGHYPGVIYEPNGELTVYGSVYMLDENSALLTVLDEYEGISNPPLFTDEYVRTVVPVDCNGRTLTCWTYLYNWPVDGKRLIESGTYSV